MFSIVVPVYRNESSLPELLEALVALDREMSGELEAVFVIDGSPDRSLDILAGALPEASFASQLVVLSRNFGSWAAIAAGLAHAGGEYCGVMAADLQEPPELMLEFRSRLLGGDCDLVVGTRASRSDPWSTRLGSSFFWRLYRALVQPEMARSGVDVFACNRLVLDSLLAMPEHNSTLVGQLYWLGYRRCEVPYVRRPRRSGRSGWTFKRRLRYLLDSVFAFSDLPVRLMSIAGLSGIVLSVVFALVILWFKRRGNIQVPGYTATILAVMFFGGLNSLGLGIIGEYLWRTFENTKGRPTYLVAARRTFGRKERQA